MINLVIFTLSYTHGREDQTKASFQKFINGILTTLQEAPFKILEENWQQQTKNDFLNLVIKLISFLQLLLKGRISHELFKKQVEAQKAFMEGKEQVIFNMLINLLTKNVWNSVYIKNEILSTLKVCFKFYNP